MQRWNRDVARNSLADNEKSKERSLRLTSTEQSLALLLRLRNYYQQELTVPSSNPRDREILRR